MVPFGLYYFLHVVAYVFEGTLLPESVVVSTGDGINLDVRCIGATGNTDIAVEVFEVGPSNISSYTFHYVRSTLSSSNLPTNRHVLLLQQTCETEAHISLSLSRGFQGAVKCQAGTTGSIAWIYFSTGTDKIFTYMNDMLVNYNYSVCVLSTSTLSDACLCTAASVNTSKLPDFVHTCERAGRACDCTNSQCMV